MKDGLDLSRSCCCKALKHGQEYCPCCGQQLYTYLRQRQK